MRHALALALVSTVVSTTAWAAPVRAGTTCQSTKIHPGALDVTLNSGDTSIVKVTGYRGPKPPVSPAPDVVFHTKAGVAYNLTAGDTSKGQTTIKIASNLSANIVVDPPSPAPSASAAATPQPAAATHPGGADDKLTATMKDERFASFSASPAPTSSPNAADAGAAPSVDYTIKGQHPGNTALVVAQGEDCIAIRVHVRPSVSDRFLATAGVGMSTVPKYAITNVTAPASYPSSASGTVTRVLKTENSGHQVSVPLLFNYRLTDNPTHNLYGTVGFFANSGGGGLVYGISLAKEQYLLTLGAHSDNVTDLAPGLRNNDIVPSGITTSVTRRVTSGFIALTLPTTFLTQLLSPGSAASKSGGSGSSATESH